MSVYRRLTAVALALILMLALAGCGEGVTAKLDFTFESGTAFEQAVDIRGVSLDDAQVAELEAVGWKVKPGSSGFTARLEFADAAAYSKPAGVLFGVLDSAFIRDAGYDPGMKPEVSVRHSVTDFVLAERHEVEVTLPTLDLAPTECPSCEGEGYADCSDCQGGDQTCSSCNGTGGSQGYYGWSECWYCDGTGDVTCDTCSGAGSLECSDCSGTGDAPEWVQSSYDEGINSSRLDVALNMPGIVTQNAEAGRSPWKLKGDEIESAESFTATSFVVNWLYAGIAATVLLLIIALIVWLVIRKIKKAFRKKPVPQAVVPASTTPPANSAAACPGCGSPRTAGAKFCRSCGTQVGNGES